MPDPVNVSTLCGPFDSSRYHRFKNAYENATTETFMFENHEYLVSFARYLVEYLAPAFEETIQL